MVPRKQAGAPAEVGAPPATGFTAVRDASERLAADVRAAVPEPASAQMAVGSILVLVGALWLAHNFDWLRWPWWLRLDTLWPLLLVALGLGLIAKSRRAVSA